MTSAALHLTYRAILRLHPADFRAEFGDEMLWIFDEESGQGHALSLLWDGLRSTAIQHIRKPPSPQYQTAGPIYIEIDSTIPAERIAQKWLVTLSCTLSLSLFLSMIVPGVATPLGRLLYNRIQILSSASARTQHTSQFSQHRTGRSTDR
jgi:hypothetical protein